MKLFDAGATLERTDVVSPVLDQALKEYRARIDRELPNRLRKLMLFGSWARGEANEDSDVDVFVLLSEATWRERAHVIDLGAYVGLDFRLAIAPLVLTDAEWDELARRERRLRTEIEKEGIEA